MPLFKGRGCKARPAKAISYITDKRKATLVTSYALDDNLSYAKQFEETYKLFNKGRTYSSRKYYHFKHSFDPKDNITAEEAHRLTEELAQKAFGDYEYIIATHNDKAHMHCHIIVNSVSFQTGKMLHINNKQYGALKDLSNVIAEKYGYSTLDFRKTSDDRVCATERQIILNGGTSWKEELREVICEALSACDNMQDFEKYLNKYGVTILRNTENNISFKHPNKSKAIRGLRLGERYGKVSILNELSKSRDWSASKAEREIERIGSNEQTGVGEQPAEGCISGICREVERVVETTKRLYSESDKDDEERQGYYGRSAICKRAYYQNNGSRGRQASRKL